MKVGNVSQSVLKRSVLKPLQTKREEVFIQPTIEEKCSGIRISKEDGIVISSTVTFGNEKDLGVYAIAEVINNITSRNAKPIGVDLIIQLPSYAYESRLKTMVELMEQCCKWQNVQIMGIKVSVSPVLNVAMVYATATGTILLETSVVKKNVKANQDIVILNELGIAGALRILDIKKEIREKFTPSFLTPLEQKKKHIFATDVIKQVLQHSVQAIHPIGTEGLLGALWNMGEVQKVGMEIDIKQIPIMQEVIEITECVSINPYQLNSIGSILVMTEDGNALVESLRKQGYTAAKIGKIIDTTERVVYNGSDKRFLDKPSPDEMLKLYEIKEEKL